MCALFRSRKPVFFERDAAPVTAPEMLEAQLAAAAYGERTGGDSHDYFRASPTRVVFAILDVAGRLDQNRAIVQAAKSALRSCGTKLLADEDANEAHAMIEICVQMNRAILKTAARVCPCPVFAGLYNETLGTVCYVNAGHTPGLLRDQTGVVELGATGLPLGLFSHSAADASMVALQPGAALLVVSRGMVEARRKGKELGLAEVKERLLHTTSQTAEEICAGLLGSVQQFLANKPPQNDITMLGLARAAAARAFAAARA